ncbi:hypothetical protein [Pedobacter suwonensis]|uniref:hypothetical protein n=1 Tax=Pedobacter suwonensis TaxID=332999 RepID=UPI00119F0A38|nr:hypothetical protein [Pedobacter suwonensis]
MFLPFFIAILLGLATPTNTNNNCDHNGGTVTTNSNTPGDPGTGSGGDGGAGGDTGGENGHLPPPKID